MLLDENRDRGSVQRHAAGADNTMIVASKLSFDANFPSVYHLETKSSQYSLQA